MNHFLEQPLSSVTAALRSGDISAVELTTQAARRHETRGAALGAYTLFDLDGALAAADDADRRLARWRRDGGAPPPPLCGVPVSVKDLYGVTGWPTYAGTRRRLPERWSRDGWLVARLRAQGAVFVGKTHTVELAYGALGVNPHRGTPVNPWDADRHRVPGGSSSGAGVTLHEGSVLVALGTDTGGSIRIPASMTGCVGHRPTQGRWPTDGVVPLSTTLDTVGALTRTAADALYFFGAIDPAWGDPEALLRSTGSSTGDAATPPSSASKDRRAPRVAVPDTALWRDCQPDVGRVLRAALDELESAGWARVQLDGRLLDDAAELYLGGAITGAECREVLERELPGWAAILHPIVGDRLARAPRVRDPAYEAAMTERARLEARSPALFGECDLLALPTALRTPPAVAELDDLERYGAANVAALRPTSPASILGLCALTLPVGLDDRSMPVGLQLVAPGGRDEALMGWAVAAERVLGTARERLGTPPLIRRASSSA